MTREFFRRVKQEPDAARRLAMLNEILAAAPDPCPDLSHLASSLQRALASLLWMYRRDSKWPQRFLNNMRIRYGEVRADECREVLVRLMADRRFALPPDALVSA